MSMSQCIICSDLFDDVERVVAAPCGHVYHSKCLLKWLDVKKSCPECRQRVVKQKILELYFNANSTQLVNPTSLNNEIENLKTMLQESSTEASRLMDKNKELSGIIEKDVVTIQTLQKTNKDLEKKLRNSIFKMSILKRRVQVGSKNEKFERKLCHLEDLEAVVSETQKDANILEHAADSAIHGTDLIIVRRLAYYCSLTKRELQETIDENNELRNKTLEINKNWNITSSELNLSKALVTKLEKKVEKLKRAVKRNVSKNRSEFNDSLNSDSSISSDSSCPKQFSNVSFGMTPITAGSESKGKRKLNVVLDKEREEVSVACNQSVSPLNFLPIAKRKRTNFVSTVEYEFLGWPS